MRKARSSSSTTASTWRWRRTPTASTSVPTTCARRRRRWSSAGLPRHPERSERLRRRARSPPRRLLRLYCLRRPGQRRGERGAQVEIVRSRFVRVLDPAVAGFRKQLRLVWGLRRRRRGALVVLVPDGPGPEVVVEAEELAEVELCRGGVALDLEQGFVVAPRRVPAEIRGAGVDRRRARLRVDDDELVMDVNRRRRLRAGRALAA